jgi:nucleoside-diphosphate-sugar epimerase
MKANYMKKYLVTGGAGFIGSAIVKEILSQGYNVKVLDSLQRGKLSKLSDIKGKFEFVKADIRDTKKVVKASSDCDGIIHLAYVNGTKFFYSKPDAVLDIAINGMLSVIEAGKENKISELFLASSSEVYQNPNIVPTPEDVPLIVPDPYNPRYSYGGGKILCELMAIHMAPLYFKKVVIVRPHNVYGPGMGEEHVIPELIRKIQKLKKAKGDILQLQGSGKETRSYIYIDDFAKQFMLTLRKGKNLTTYNLGNQEEISSNELAKKICFLMNSKAKPVPGVLQKGSTPRRCPDVSKIKELGFESKFTLEEGLKRTIEWYDKNMQ